jgi:hypothetical protein
MQMAGDAVWLGGGMLPQPDVSLLDLFSLERSMTEVRPHYVPEVVEWTSPTEP